MTLVFKANDTGGPSATVALRQVASLAGKVRSMEVHDSGTIVVNFEAMVTTRGGARTLRVPVARNSVLFYRPGRGAGVLDVLPKAKFFAQYTSGELS